MRNFLPLLLAAGLAAAAAAADTPAVMPLPVNRSLDKYESRDEFLRRAAAFETARLKRLRFDAGREAEVFAGAGDLAVDLGGGLAVRFRRIAASHYVDGCTPELKAAVLAVDNRAHDLRRWEKMFETGRRDRVAVPYDFFMAETIVTNAMFAAFVRETGYRTSVERYTTGWVVDGRAQWLQGFANDWRLQVPPLSEPDHPVVQVSWFDAMNFAAWLSAKAGVVFRVPTKEEWYLAARPEAMRDEVCLFPWGNALEGIEGRMNFGTRELADYGWIHEQFADGHAYSSPVRAYPANSRGLHDMLGNVWVWNWTNAADYEARGAGDRTARAAALDGLGVATNRAIAMQGGCYLARLSHANLLSKMSHPALDGAEDIGFRLVAVRRADSGL
ncbi:MAG: SUMF1/EgtB/PvdO family nonheme iron enzyme [Opitutaceae bacterium]|nr:SUMF1/EgtB/PvdO family nonheme iron enzyme [Opitutaceae bacterium]